MTLSMMKTAVNTANDNQRQPATPDAQFVSELNGCLLIASPCGLMSLSAPSAYRKQPPRLRAMEADFHPQAVSQLSSVQDPSNHQS